MSSGSFLVGDVCCFNYIFLLNVPPHPTHYKSHLLCRLYCMLSPRQIPPLTRQPRVCQVYDCAALRAPPRSCVCLPSKTARKMPGVGDMLGVWEIKEVTGRPRQAEALELLKRLADQASPTTLNNLQPPLYRNVPRCLPAGEIDAFSVCEIVLLVAAVSHAASPLSHANSHRVAATLKPV